MTVGSRFVALRCVVLFTRVLEAEKWRRQGIWGVWQRRHSRGRRQCRGDGEGEDRVGDVSKLWWVKSTQQPAGGGRGTGSEVIATRGRDNDRDCSVVLRMVDDDVNVRWERECGWSTYAGVQRRWRRGSARSSARNEKDEKDEKISNDALTLWRSDAASCRQLPVADSWLAVRRLERPPPPLFAPPRPPLLPTYQPTNLPIQLQFHFFYTFDSKCTDDLLWFLN